MKKCPNGHENPDYANYCRVCRHEFTHDGDGKKSNVKKLETELSNIRGSTPPKTPPTPKAGSSSYTPTAFPGINFTPRSMFNPHFRIFLWFFLMVIGVGGIVLYSIVLSEDVRDEFGEVMDVALYTGMGVVTYLFLLMLCVSICVSVIVSV